MEKNNFDNDNGSLTIGNHGYALNGKIMFCSVVILFVCVIFILCFHSYANWIFRRQQARRRSLRIRRHLLSLPSDANTVSASRGLDPFVLSLIPVFVFSARKSGSTPPECAVCLSEFEEKEEGRVLPKCSHVFHVDCIDMWFVSHSNCPLCRAPVTVPGNQVSPPEIQISAASTGEESAGVEPERSGGEDLEMGSSFWCSSSSSAAASGERKRMELAGIVVEVPRGPSSIGGTGSEPAGNRVVSLKRVWSI